MYSMFENFGMLHILREGLREKRRKPIVFVPGLYGSMGNEIISGTGDWSFGMSAPFYDPFIKMLEGLGYKRNVDLFIAFYDWRKSCKFCAHKYLIKTIDEAKSAGKDRKIHIIGHSMGGLVSRAYLQSKGYRNDVEHFILLGTPNAGAVNAYYFWAGGRLPYKENIKTNIFATLLEGYLWILEKLYGTENDMNTIHEYLEGAKDLLPSVHYGNYLFFLDGDKRKHFIPYRKMKYQNHFLDYLNVTQYLLKRRRIKVTLIAGKGFSTNSQLEIDRYDKDDKDRWINGKVIGAISSQEGDGTVMLKSVFALDGDKYILHGSHTEILQQCTFILKKKFGVEEKLYRSTEGFLNDYISILVYGDGDINIKCMEEKGQMILYNGNVMKEGICVQEYNKGLKWIILSQWLDKELFIEYRPRKSGTVEIKISDSLGNKKEFKEEVKKTRIYPIQL